MKPFAKAAAAFVLSLTLGSWATMAPAQGAPCAQRGDLDQRYCDEDGDLVADRPKDPKAWQNPSSLVFSYTPVEDPAVYENVFADFMAHLAKVTGKRIRWFPAESYAAQVEAMRSGRLHHDGNPVLGWCIGNVVGQEDRRGNLFPAKQRDGKIDAAVALLMAVGRAQADDGAADIDAFLREPLIA